jgi:hypothetical protein
MAARAPADGNTRPDLLRYAPIGRNEADRAAFAAGYDAFVRWIEQREVVSRVDEERDAVEAAAPQLLDLRRLEQWAESSREPVRYSDFGIDAPDPSTLDVVPPAYTSDVWNSLVRDLVGAVEATGGTSSAQVDQFRQSYVQNFDKHWENFLLGTPTVASARGRRKDSPYLALIEEIDKQTRTDLPRDGPLPPWIQLLREVRRTTPTTEEEEKKELAPWQRYMVAIDQVDATVGPATEHPDQALELVQRMESTDETSVDSALALVRELVRTGRNTPTTRKLREVLSMPIEDGGADVFASALTGLDRSWRENIATRYSGTLTSQQLEEFYRPDGGELSRFMSETGLSDLYADGRAVPVLDGAGLALGPGFLAWMQHAMEMQRALYPGPGELPSIAVRLEGIPSKIVGASGLFVTRRDLRLSCAEDDQTFVYREGSGSYTFNWTPHCQDVSLRVWAREGGTERELRPPKRWSGPLAFPQLLQRAQRLPDDRLRWQLDYEGAELVVEYRMRAGDAILEIAHRAPPSSMRN